MRWSMQRNTQRDQKKKQRNLLILSFFLIAIMFFSVFGYVASYSTPSGSQVTEYGLTFEQRYIGQQIYWQTRVSGEPINMLLLPRAVEAYDVPQETVQQIQQATEVLIIVDPLLATDPILQESVNTVEQAIPVPRSYGQTSEGGLQLPIASCNDTSAQFPGIIFAYANQTDTQVQEGCTTFFVESSTDLLYTAHKLTYELLGVDYDQIG